MARGLGHHESGPALRDGLAAGGIALSMLAVACGDSQAQSQPQSQAAPAAVIATQANQSQTLKRDIDWLTSDQAGDLATSQVRVTSIVVDTVTLDAGLGPNGERRTRETDESFVIVTVRVTNTSDEPIDYASWSDRPTTLGAGHRAFMTDEDNAAVGQVAFGLVATPIGRSSGVTLKPGKSVTDILIFEIPDEDTEALYLELPGGAVEAPGALHYALPVPK